MITSVEGSTVVKIKHDERVKDEFKSRQRRSMWRLPLHQNWKQSWMKPGKNC